MNPSAGALAPAARPSISLFACIWDSDTLADEKLTSPRLASVILDGPPTPPNPRPIRDRIARLKAAPREGEPSWWNDLAGAHLRLGEAAEAARLLEPLVTKFPNDYGIHANLGTAYHLLGRYADAERHIARDLEINPDAHFGLERYHLALLQYLVRDAAYQKDHFYLDEFSPVLEQRNWYVRGFFQFVLPGLLATDENGPAPGDAIPPAYRRKWNLADDPKLEDGVAYLATLNPNQPACHTMLGLICLRKKNADLHLAAIAFKRAIALNSPQRKILQGWVSDIEKHVSESHSQRNWQSGELWPRLLIIGALLCLFGGVLVFNMRRSRKWTTNRLGHGKQP